MKKGKHPDHHPDGDIGQGAVSPQAGKDDGRVMPVEILHRQGLVRGLEIVKTDGHNYGGHEQARKGGEKAGGTDTDPQQHHGPRRQAVFPHDQQHVHHQKGQEARNLTYRLGHPDLKTVYAHYLFGKIGEQGHPSLQSGAGTDNENHEIGIHRFILEFLHGGNEKPETASRGTSPVMYS